MEINRSANSFGNSVCFLAREPPLIDGSYPLWLVSTWLWIGQWALPLPGSLCIQNPWKENWRVQLSTSHTTPEFRVLTSGTQCAMLLIQKRSVPISGQSGHTCTFSCSVSYCYNLHLGYYWDVQISSLSFSYFMLVLNILCSFPPILYFIFMVCWFPPTVSFAFLLFLLIYLFSCICYSSEPCPFVIFIMVVLFLV